MPLKLYSCGSKVVTKLSNIEAIITGISIRFNAVSYELSYFINAEYKQVWLNECEFNISDKEVKRIGFRK